MRIFGILNITPDSFSDGGNYLDHKVAYDRAVIMANEGADIIDIGAESTRPDAKTLTPTEEWERLEPVFKLLKQENFKTPISIDSRNHETIHRALDFGASIVNDVSGLNDTKIIPLVTKYNVKSIFMHSLSIPADKNRTLPENEDVVIFLKNWANNKMKYLEDHSIKKENLVFDAGIGFGKTAKQNLEIIKRISEFKTLGVPILIGHSEKSFLTLFTNKPAGKRNIETSIITSYLAAKNVDYVRVHNINEAIVASKIGKNLYA